MACESGKALKPEIGVKRGHWKILPVIISANYCSPLARGLSNTEIKKNSLLIRGSIQPIPYKELGHSVGPYASPG
jgi:hypothetical protein